MTERIAHLVNPVSVSPASDLHLAQPITFASMRQARDRARAAGLSVDLLMAQYPEDRAMAPADFTATPDLTRSSADLDCFRVRRKLPFFADLLARLSAPGPAGRLIYTNVDIALQPDFYEAVAALGAETGGPLVINRRTVLASPEQAQDLEWLSAQPGLPHGGFDCFVFPRGLLDGVDFGRLLIGAAGFGKTLVAVLSTLGGERFRLLKDAHLTFHLNNDRPWRDDSLLDYWAFNLAEGARTLERLRLRCGRLSPLAEELSQKSPPRLKGIPAPEGPPCP